MSFRVESGTSQCRQQRTPRSLQRLLRVNLVTVSSWPTGATPCSENSRAVASGATLRYLSVKKPELGRFGVGSLLGSVAEVVMTRHRNGRTLAHREGGNSASWPSLLLVISRERAERRGLQQLRRPPIELEAFRHALELRRTLR